MVAGLPAAECVDGAVWPLHAPHVPCAVQVSLAVPHSVLTVQSLVALTAHDPWHEADGKFPWHVELAHAVPPENEPFEQVCRLLPEHCVWPGAQVPWQLAEPTAPRQVELLQALPPEYAPEEHVCRTFPEQAVWPGEHDPWHDAEPAAPRHVLFTQVLTEVP